MSYLQRSHLETMSGSNKYDKLEKYVIISLILMCNTVTISYIYLLHYLIYIFEENKKSSYIFDCVRINNKNTYLYVIQH